MIPVFQTRYAVETFGNCFEACLASILELPLSAVPDRAALVDADAWADRVAQARLQGPDSVLDLELPAEYDDGERAVREWLFGRGLAWINVELVESGMTPEAWLDLTRKFLPEAYWIAHTVAEEGWKHATVWLGDELVHNPHRDAPLEQSRLGRLVQVTILVAGNPARVARLKPLPDVAGALAAVAA